MNIRLLCLSMLMLFANVVASMDRGVLEPEDTLLQKYQAGQKFWVKLENKERRQIKQEEQNVFDQLQQDYRKLFAAVIAPVRDIKPRSKKSVRSDMRQEVFDAVQEHESIQRSKRVIVSLEKRQRNKIEQQASLDKFLLELSRLIAESQVEK